MRSLFNNLQSNWNIFSLRCITFNSSNSPTWKEVVRAQYQEFFTYSVSAAGWYRITAVGAAASRGNAYPNYTMYYGGVGATVSSMFYLKIGEQLRILSPKKGLITDATSADGSSGGGGGAAWVFKVIPAITDSRYQYLKEGAEFNGEKWECLICAAGGCSNGDAGYSASYRNNGNNAITSVIYTPSNYIAPSPGTAATMTTASSSPMGINQIMKYNGYGAYYTRNGSQSAGGYGCGCATDDQPSYGGCWYGSNNNTYSWSSGEQTKIMTHLDYNDGSVTILGVF